MLVLVTGSREWAEPTRVRLRLRQLPRGTTIIHGGARGLDRMAASIARGLGLRVLPAFEADWKRYGLQAGHIRNDRMLDEKPDLVIGFWKDASTGTGSCLRKAKKRGIPIEKHTTPLYVPEAEAANWRTD